MAFARYDKGVFCMECEWYGDPTRRFSVEHILRVVDQLVKPRYKHIHYDVSTHEEFWFLLKKWTQRKYRATHPILYLGFHGEEGAIYLREDKRSPRIGIDEIREQLKGRCAGRVLFFGSCETLNSRHWRPSSFLRDTGALAICGYKEYIDWMLSAAMDLIVLSAMQEHPLNLNGIRAIASRIKERAAGLKHDLGFRIYTAKGEA